jgi:hypothetical protein
LTIIPDLSIITSAKYGDKMKIFIELVILLSLVGMLVFAQYRNRPESMPTVTESIIRSDDGGLLFGWFNPSKLSFHNSYSLSYTTTGGKGFSLGSLTSSIGYQISDPLSLQFDVSLMHSPYSDFGNQFSKNVSGIYLTRAALNYRPSKSTLLQIQFSQLPSLYWLNNYNRFGFMSGFNSIEEEESH